MRLSELHLELGYDHLTGLPGKLNEEVFIETASVWPNRGSIRAVPFSPPNYSVLASQEYYLRAKILDFISTVNLENN